MNTVLYAASAASLADPELAEAAYRAVSEERKRKTDRLRRPEDKRLSLCAELLLRYGLREAGVLSSDSRSGGIPELTYGPQGKPRLKNGGIGFSLTHSGEYAVCAVSSSEVGCDAEQIGNADPALARRFFCPEEAADAASRTTEEERRRTFFRYWTLKESFLKVTGLGMKLPLNAFRIVLPSDEDPSEKSGIAVRQTEAGSGFPEIFSGREYRFAEFSDLPGYCCAVCTEGIGESAVLRRLELTDLL